MPGQGLILLYLPTGRRAAGKVGQFLATESIKVKKKPVNSVIEIVSGIHLVN